MAKLGICFGILLTILNGFFGEVRENPKLFVQISNGVLKGKDNNGQYISWESVPYAEAPVGDLRYEDPQPYRQQWNGIFDASQMAPVCMQWDQFVEGDYKVHGTEDCLKLNIYKPTTGEEKEKEDFKYPVMVFIHGGCFMFGGVNVNQPHRLMASGKIMLVTIAYRLGALGFLSAEDEALPGNLGLKDQRLALRWIKKNIAHFGGDPHKILLTGFSAGGASTHFHILQRPQENVAKAAVSFSGVALNPWVLIRNPKRRALKLAEILKCPQGKNGLEIKMCLKQQKAEDIVAATGRFQNFAYNPFTVFGPVVEPPNTPGAFLTQHPIEIIKSGNFTHIPWLASYVSEDGGYNAAELMQINPLTGRELMYQLNDNWQELLATNLFLFNNDLVMTFVMSTVHMDDFSLILPMSSRSPPRPDEKRIAQHFIQMLVDFVEKGNLCFDQCDFTDNSVENSPNLYLTSITRDTCGTVAIEV